MSVQISPGILGLTAQIVSAHLSHNRLEPDALPSFIQSVYRSLSTVDDVQSVAAPALSPAVPIKKSVFPDYIVCLEDGKKLKMLKRHLHTSYGLTPETYRAKWGLPRDYPMVAPVYAAARSRLAKKIGLRRKPDRVSVETNLEPASVESDLTKLPSRRTRDSKG